MRLRGRGPVNSPTRITLENNGKIRPQPDRENAFARVSGGESARLLIVSVPIHAYLLHSSYRMFRGIYLRCVAMPIRKVQS